MVLCMCLCVCVGVCLPVFCMPCCCLLVLVFCMYICYTMLSLYACMPNTYNVIARATTRFARVRLVCSLFARANHTHRVRSTARHTHASVWKNNKEEKRRKKHVKENTTNTGPETTRPAASAWLGLEQY